MDAEPSEQEDYTLEVEEAELSSEEELASPQQSTTEIVLPDADRRPPIHPASHAGDDHDVVVGDEANDQLHPASAHPNPPTNGVRPSPHDDDESSTSSAAGNHPADSSMEDPAGISDPPRSDVHANNNHSNRHSGSDISDDDAVSHPPRKYRGEDPDSDYNESDGDGSDASEEISDADDVNPLPASRPAGGKLVIPDDMLDNQDFFRRSNRSRKPPMRLAGSANDSASSEGAADSDSEYDAHDGK